MARQYFFFAFVVLLAAASSCADDEDYQNLRSSAPGAESAPADEASEILTRRSDGQPDPGLAEEPAAVATLEAEVLASLAAEEELAPEPPLNPQTHKLEEHDYEALHRR